MNYSRYIKKIKLYESPPHSTHRPRRRRRRHAHAASRPPGARHRQQGARGTQAYRLGHCVSSRAQPIHVGDGRRGDVPAKGGTPLRHLPEQVRQIQKDALQDTQQALGALLHARHALRPFRAPAGAGGRRDQPPLCGRLPRLRKFLPKRTQAHSLDDERREPRLGRLPLYFRQGRVLSLFCRNRRRVCRH